MTEESLEPVFVMDGVYHLYGTVRPGDNGVHADVAACGAVLSEGRHRYARALPEWAAKDNAPPCPLCFGERG